MGHGSTPVTEPRYRHEIWSMVTEGATAMNRILNAKVASWLRLLRGTRWLPNWLPKLISKNASE